VRPLRKQTVRWRLTALLSSLILVTSVVLLVLSYVLVNANLSYNTHRPVAKPNAGRPPAGASLQSSGGGTRQPGSRAPLTLSASAGQVAHHERSALLAQYAVILGALLVVAALVAWLIAGRMLRPLRTITAGAKRITGERLHERLALSGPPDEIKDLGDTFDAMLGRLELAFQDQQLFAANAAHELRTPLGVMHAELDLALAGEQPAEQQLMLQRLKRMVSTCERLTERLFSLTRGQLAATERQPVALDQIAAERLARADVSVSDLTVRSDLRPLVVEGDAALLGQLVENLVDNAAKYNVPRGWIQVRVCRDGGHGILEVANSGPEVREDEIAGLLEPFRRATQQRVGSGNGLGLSIVRTIVAAHGGQLALHALRDGGLRVTVTLPCPGERLRDQAADEHPVTHGRR
jgi:signal transduction histidine kinase